MSVWKMYYKYLKKHDGTQVKLNRSSVRVQKCTHAETENGYCIIQNPLPVLLEMIFARFLEGDELRTANEYCIERIKRDKSGVAATAMCRDFLVYYDNVLNSRTSKALAGIMSMDVDTVLFKNVMNYSGPEISDMGFLLALQRLLSKLDVKIVVFNNWSDGHVVSLGDMPHVAILNRVQQSIWQLVLDPKEEEFVHNVKTSFGNYFYTQNLPELSREQLQPLKAWWSKKLPPRTSQPQIPAPNVSTFLDFYSSNVYHVIPDGTIFSIQEALWCELNPVSLQAFVDVCLPQEAKMVFSDEKSIRLTTFGLLEIRTKFLHVYLNLLYKALFFVGVTVRNPEESPHLFIINKDLKPAITTESVIGIIKSMNLVILDRYPRLVSTASSHLVSNFVLPRGNLDKYLVEMIFEEHRIKNSISIDFVMPGVAEDFSVIDTVKRVIPELWHHNISDLVPSNTKCLPGTTKYLLVEKVKMAILTDIMAPFLHWPKVLYWQDMYLQDNIDTLVPIFLKPMPTSAKILVVPLTTRQATWYVYRCVLIFHIQEDQRWVEFYNPCNLQDVSNAVRISLVHAAQTAHPSWQLQNFYYYEMIKWDKNLSGRRDCFHGGTHQNIYRGACDSRLFSYVTASVNNVNLYALNRVAAFVNSSEMKTKSINKTLFAMAFRWLETYKYMLTNEIKENYKYKDLLEMTADSEETTNDEKKKSAKLDAKAIQVAMQNIMLKF
jgi:hypothetical protein